jgi:hypothetical protein
MEWLLTISGVTEIFGKNGVPESTIDYEHQLQFETLLGALNFIELTELHSVQTHTYKLEAM